MRRRLVRYFDRKRVRSPDELADETLNRVARRLEEESGIDDTPPARYCYIVARFVLLEYARREHGRSTRADVTIAAPPGPDTAAVDREMLLHCLDRCLQKLDADERALILDYYQGEQRTKIEQRRTLAARLKLTPNALSIRACRIRMKLEACVHGCSTRK
jgi:DNA-directed RNA polymerase specialized sigma24 family protein